MQAAYRKYPNPITTSVTGVDVLQRNVDEQGVLRSTRVMQTEWGLPAWACAIVGMDRTVYAHETSEVDPQRQTMRLNSRNLTFCNFISIEEHLRYEPSPQNPQNHTLLTQEAVITVKGVPLTSYLEDIVTSNIDSNAGKGRSAMEWVIGKIKTETEDLRRRACELASEAEDKLKMETQPLLKQAEELTKRAEELGTDLSKRAEELGTDVSKKAEEVSKLIAGEAEDLSKKISADVAPMADDVGKLSKKVLENVDELLSGSARPR